MNPHTNPTAIDHTVKEHNVGELQQKLRALSYADDTLPRPAVTGIRDDVTDQALHAFQRSIGAGESDSVDYATWQALDAAYRQCVRRWSPYTPLYPVGGDAFFSMPMPHTFVLLLQVLLLTLSRASDEIPPVSLTGVMDENTAQSVAAVQSLSGLPPTGQLDAVTWDTIAALYNLQAKKFIASPPIR